LRAEPYKVLEDSGGIQSLTGIILADLVTLQEHGLYAGFYGLVSTTSSGLLSDLNCRGACVLPRLTPPSFHSKPTITLVKPGLGAWVKCDLVSHEDMAEAIKKVPLKKRKIRDDD